MVFSKWAITVRWSLRASGIGQHAGVVGDGAADLLPVELDVGVLVGPERAEAVVAVGGAAADRECLGLRVDREQDLLLHLAGAGFANPVHDRELVASDPDVRHG